MYIEYLHIYIYMLMRRALPQGPSRQLTTRSPTRLPRPGPLTKRRNAIGTVPYFCYKVDVTHITLYYTVARRVPGSLRFAGGALSLSFGRLAARGSSFFRQGCDAGVAPYIARLSRPRQLRRARGIMHPAAFGCPHPKESGFPRQPYA